MEFSKFGKIPRFSRDIIITEKIDGTNGCIGISEENEFFTGSRSRWVTPEDDNHGFSRWANEHKEELLTLGPGLHFGEWWGQGIQRKYGLTEKRFSLFNVGRWCLFGKEPKIIDNPNPTLIKSQDILPACCGLVPVLYEGAFNHENIHNTLKELELNGSSASPGFMNPEGIIIFHTASRYLFKKTIKNDEKPKGSKE